MPIYVDFQHMKEFIQYHEFTGIAPQVRIAHRMLHSGAGTGGEYTGWLHLPSDYDKAEFSRLQQAALQIQEDTDIFIVIGIGGSYLGARAAIEFLKSPYYNALQKQTPEIYFAGNSLSSASLTELLNICKGKRVSLNVISKSGTTTEPAIAFRVLRQHLEQEYGKEGAKNRIYCTTDKEKGALKELAEAQGYQTFEIPENIGGRFSVFTAAGLLPMAVCGVDIAALLQGAAEAQRAYNNENINENACYQYAAARNLLNRKGKDVELLVSYEPCFAMLGEWWKQLFGESEGKDQKGIFPAYATFSTDLHSMGQYLQDGKRILFETAVLFEHPKYDIVIENSPEIEDGLHFLEGKTLWHINQKAFEGTALAHRDGGVPSMVVRVPDFSEYSLGWLFYFFEKACAISGYLLGVNPFNQPGVENYKNNMFALLGKPGHEQQQEILTSRLR